MKSKINAGRIFDVVEIEQLLNEDGQVDIKQLSIRAPSEEAAINLLEALGACGVDVEE